MHVAFAPERSYRYIVCTTLVHGTVFFFLFRMGRKFRLSVHRKNEERKRYKVTSLTVSIPLELVTVTTPPCQQERRTTAVFGVPSPCSKLSHPVFMAAHSLHRVSSKVIV